MGWRNNRPSVWWSNVCFDRLGIQWDSGSVTLTQGISNCSLQNYFENKIPFCTQFLANFCLKLFKITYHFISFLQFLLTLNPKTKSVTHCLTELFPIYQNKYWTIKRQNDCSVDPSTHHILLKIVGFLVYFPPIINNHKIYFR